MNRPFALRVASGLVLVLVPLIGTGCGEDWQAPTFPATGRLTINGEPGRGALVQLIARGAPPDARNSRPWGQVKEDGSFELATYGVEPGAPAGEYGVAITWPVDSAVMGSPDRLGGKYADAATTGLTVTLRAEPTQIPEIRLDRVPLDGKPRAGRTAATMPPMPR